MKSLLSAALLLATAASAQTVQSHIYIQTPQGVDVYTLNSANKLNLVAGSPFKTVGLGAATNGKYWISVGTNILHVYSISQTSGAIGGQVSQIDTSIYAGGECGTTGETTLDHTGLFFYVAHNNMPIDVNSNHCLALQTFKMNSSNGQFTFMGDMYDYTNNHVGASRNPSITASEALAFGGTDMGWNSFGVVGYSRNLTTGDFTGMSSITSVPSIGPSDGGVGWAPIGVTPENSNHLAVVLASVVDPPYPQYADPALASYTFTTSGVATTTNATPLPLTVAPTVLNMSPSGKILAVGGGVNPNGLPLAFGSNPGFQLFHFNGSAPITPFSSVLTTTPIDYVHWDNYNHVYALSATTGKLYIWTATATSITPVPGSPFTIKSTKGTSPYYATALAVR
jgi:hypothetical protein